MAAIARSSSAEIQDATGSENTRSGDNVTNEDAKSKPSPDELQAYLSTLRELAFVDDDVLGTDEKWRPDTTLRFIALTCGVFWLSASALLFYIW